MIEEPMQAIAGKTERRPEFQRNLALEALLAELNTALQPTEADYRQAWGAGTESWPIVFIMGMGRSGTTLLLQMLASTGLVAYPTNLLARFYGAPITGARIQRLLTDPKFDYRGELADIGSPWDFSSDIGKTQGALAPAVFWYFWRRFFADIPRAAFGAGGLESYLGATDFRPSLAALTRAFEQPFALKGMILNQDVPALRALFPKALFVWAQRDPVANAQSMLYARWRQNGSYDSWFSFKIREYPDLVERPPIESVTGQIHYTNKALAQAFAELDESQQLIVDYSKLCRQPAAIYDQIAAKLQALEPAVPVPAYPGPDSFPLQDGWYLSDIDPETVAAAVRAWAAFDPLDDAAGALAPGFGTPHRKPGG